MPSTLLHYGRFFLSRDKRMTIKGAKKSLHTSATKLTCRPQLRHKAPPLASLVIISRISLPLEQIIYSTLTDLSKSGEIRLLCLKSVTLSNDSSPPPSF